MEILPRAAASLLARALGTMRVVVVTGPRQAGKSTFAEHHPGLADYPYLSLDDPATLRRARENPAAFVRSERRMTIDEVQREPDLILAVKSIVDRQRPAVRGQFVLTGAANLLMMKRVGDSLAGRAYYLRLWPMTRREQLGLGSTGTWSRFFEEDVPRWLDLVRADTAPRASWQAQSARGGFPEVTVEPDRSRSLSAPERALWFDGYITTYLERDLRDLAAVADLADFQRVMQAAALRIGNLLNQSEIGRDVRLPAMTVHRYLNLLETSYQIIRLSPYAANRAKRLIKTPKLYWNDPGLALHLGHAGTAAEPTGAHFENLVLCDLVAWRDAQVPRADITYWRTATGHEVDFVVEHQRELLGIEVKAGAQPGQRDIRGLRAFLDDHPRRARGGIVLHGGEESYWLDETILAVPWWKVM
ncbi:MAG: ATP-binding protein [Gemmatimonadaceae bacterium]|nr:ATP-binding protein [Gemmatimonadaceae bacterium]